ncbi:MAG: hypothetical protein ACOYXB_00670 [Bacteroidota bacterium]
MKKLALFILAVLIPLALSAQDEREYHTVFEGKPLRITGMGGPFMQFTSVAGEFGHMMGGGGAVIVNDFFFGGYGLGLTNQIIDYAGGDLSKQLYLGHGGFWTGYIFRGDRAVHATVSTLIGFGEFGLTDVSVYLPVLNPDRFFILAPTVELEINLARYFRIGAGASYNLYSGIGDPRHSYNSSDLSSPAAFLSFKFGWF